MGEVTEPIFSADSILDSVKKDLGISVEYTHFDPDIIMGINTSFSILNQLGVGPDSGFSIVERSAVWSDFLGTDPNLDMVKTFVAKKTKQFFDPPQTGPMAEALERLLKELEFRINVMVDPKTEENNNGI